MNLTMASEYFLLVMVLTNLPKVITRDTQLLKLSKTCSALINLPSDYVNSKFLCKNKDSYTWFQTTDCFNSVVFVINSFKNQNFRQALENFYYIFH